MSLKDLTEENNGKLADEQSTLLENEASSVTGGAVCACSDSTGETGREAVLEAVAEKTVETEAEEDVGAAVEEAVGAALETVDKEADEAAGICLPNGNAANGLDDSEQNGALNATMGEAVGEEMSATEEEIAVGDAAMAVIGGVNADMVGAMNVGTAGVGAAGAASAGKEKKRGGVRLGLYLFFKRTFDLLSAGLLFVVLSPVILLCLLIKFLEDFHNPVYVSKRVGKNGKEFRFFKIRTMCVGADKMKQELIDKGLNEADGPAFKMANDPRITKFGRFLRKSSLDETLQLFNIINGTMSVVGPRPPLPREVEEYTEAQMRRLDVKGGLLCLWQIQKNRNRLTFDEWVKLDLEYIEKRSFALDMKIIFKGAYMVVFDHSGE